MKKYDAPAGTGSDRKSVTADYSVGIVFKLSDNTATVIFRWVMGGS